ncbi:MAG: hypothetical protein INQ03_11220 [Candidatus Heimdallarchaeota archaeon]|nr:hypothetical protein [Candidatus Heimdallarchaeota archaeon]
MQIRYILLLSLFVLIPVSNAKIISISLSEIVLIEVGDQDFAPTFALYSDTMIVAGGNYKSQIYTYNLNGTLIDEMDRNESPLINAPRGAETIRELDMYMVRDLGGMMVFFDVNTNITLNEEITRFRNYAIDVQGQWESDVTEDGILAYAAGYGNIFVFDLNTNSFLLNYTSPGYDYHSIAISQDGSKVAYTRWYYRNAAEYENEPKNFTILDVSTGDHLYSTNVSLDYDMEFTRAGELVLASENGLQIMNMEDYSINTISTKPGLHFPELHPIHDLVFIAGQSCTTYVYNHYTGEMQLLLDHQSCSWSTIDFSLDGSVLMTTYAPDNRNSAIKVDNLQFELDTTTTDIVDTTVSSQINNSTISDEDSIIKPTPGIGIFSFLIIPMIMLVIHQKRPRILEND